MEAAGSGATVLGWAIAVIGTVACFFGHRVFKAVLALGGFLAGGFVMAAVTMFIANDDGWALVALLLGGILGAGFAVRLYKVGVFLLGAFVGTTMALAGSGGSPQLTLVLFLAAGFGVLALALERFLIIVSTSFAGAFAIAAGAGFGLTNGDVNPLGLGLSSFGLQALTRRMNSVEPLFYLGWVALGLIGVVVQYRARTARPESTATVARPRREAAVSPPLRPAATSSKRLEAPSIASSPPAHPRVVPAAPAARRNPSPPSPETPTPAADPPPVADPAATEAEMARLAVRLKESRDRFREGLAGLREESFALARSAGPALASWRGSVWEGWDAAAAEGAGGLGDVGVGVGDVNLFAGGEGEDMWSVPAVVAPARWGALVVAAGVGEVARVRGALVGWCVRLLAVAGPGRVAVVWFEEGRAEGVPVGWRAPAGASLAAWYAERLAAFAAGEEAGVRWVVVGVGSVVDGVADVARWVTAQAAAGVAAGVTLLLAPSRRLEVAGEGVVGLAAMPGGGGRFQLLGGALGRHEVLLQEAPPTELLERYAAWALPWSGAPDATEASPIQPSPAPVAGSAEVVHREPPADDPGGPPDTVERLRALLAAPASATPRSLLGYDERQRPVEVALDTPLRLIGGSAEGAAARLATHLFEIACQTHASAWEFAVLDFSDDVRVADHFDAILDLTPHLIEYADGVSAHLKLDDTLDRLDHPDPDHPHLTLFVLAHPTHPLPEGLDRVQRTGHHARVHTLVWHPTSSGAKPQPGDTVLTLTAPPQLRTVGQPARNLRLPHCLTLGEAAALAHALQQARA
jgi:hypothetical protein